MHQTKLIEIIRCFDQNEVKQFEVFLESPFFNKSEKLLSFYRMLIQYHPDFDSPQLDKEKIYKKLHGKSAYKDQTMRALTVSLLKLVKEFIAIQQVKKRPVDASNLRYEWLSEKGLIKIQEQELAYSDDLLNKYEQKDYNYYYQRWMADYYEHNHQSMMLRDLEHKLLKKKGFGYHIHSLNKFYLLRVLETYINMLNMSKIYNTNMSFSKIYRIDLSLAKHIDVFAERYIGRGDPMIDVFYNIYQLLNSGDEKFFFKLKSLLLANNSSLPRAVKTEMSINLENYCIQRLRSGHKEFSSEIMEIIHFVVENELMIENGELSYTFYKNVITIVVDRDIQWLKEFVEKYKSKLSLQCREEAYNFGKAYILFTEKKYEEALRITSELSTYNDFTKLDVKNLTARIHYELGMFEQLDVLLDSYQHHLNRETLISARKSVQMLFTRFMRQMISLNQQYSGSAWKKLSAEINETPAFTNKAWFQEKMNEMAGKHNP